jgi:hypothetical protein
MKNPTLKDFNSILGALANHKPVKNKPTPKDHKKMFYALKKQGK